MFTICYSDARHRGCFVSPPEVRDPDVGVRYEVDRRANRCVLLTNTHIDNKHVPEHKQHEYIIHKLVYLQTCVRSSTFKINTSNSIPKVHERCEERTVHSQSVYSQAAQSVRTEGCVLYSIFEMVQNTTIPYSVLTAICAFGLRCGIGL